MKNSILLSVPLGICLFCFGLTPAAARLHARYRYTIDDPIQRGQATHQFTSSRESLSTNDFIWECVIPMKDFHFPDDYVLKAEDQIQVFRATTASGEVNLAIVVLESVGAARTANHYYTVDKLYCPRHCDIVYPTISSTDEMNVMDGVKSCSLAVADLNTVQAITAVRRDGLINWVAIGGNADAEIMQAIVRQRPTYLRLFLATGEFFGVESHDYVILTMHDADGNSANATIDGKEIYYVIGDTFNGVNGLESNVSTSAGWPPLPIN
jgi:hypothetical protein